MRVLVVTSVPPVPEGGAAARCLVGLLRGLEAHGINAHVLCPGDPERLAGQIPAGLSVELFKLAPSSRRQMRWERLVTPHSELGGNPFAARVRERAREMDIAHFVESGAAAAIGVVECPALVQLHCLTRSDPRVWNPLRGEGRTSIGLLRAERRARKHSRWMLVNSVEVGRALEAISPRAPVAVAPVALDPSAYEPSASLAEPVAGLIGTAKWPPTANAVERLLRNVWPRVLERRPDARLALAGRGIERGAFAHLPDLPGVEWHGSVPSAADFLRQLGLLLYPLTAGSGVKVKVLEALALGLPVATTRNGAEGILGRSGIRVEADDRALACAAADLLGDGEVRRTAGEAALANFHEHHSPALAAVPVIDLYERMLA